MSRPQIEAIRPPHILAIDADRDLRRLYHTLFAFAGYQVTTLPYERRSVTAVVATAPDLLLIDYLWHDPVAGRAFIQRLRATQPWLPIIVCSATLPAAPPATALAALRLTFVPKPFTGRQMLAAIEEWLPTPVPLLAHVPISGAGAGAGAGVAPSPPTADERRPDHD